jgi:uncharacterized protein YcfJ
MTLKPTVAAVLVALAAQPALADRYQSYYSPRPAYTTVRVADQRYGRDVIYARVISADPIVRHVTVSTPHRECWDETVYRDKPGNGVGAVLAGGLLGAAFGHQFGSGSGNDAATVAGAVVGSTVAHNVVSKNRYDGAYPETVQRCETTSDLHEEERIEGYNVTYEYNGQRYMTRTREDPGNEIAVRVSVTPVGY